jgi:predicted transcriptional regulator
MMSKIDDKKLRTVQVTFNKLKEYDNVSTDTRFTEVLIKILHLGRNYNGSIFNKDIVQNAIPSLANIPILGFIETNKEGEEDFSDHRVALVQEKDKKVMRYMGNCYGVISESFAKDAYFQKELCSDGIEREFLFVKGLLFNKFDYVLDIFDESNGIKSQSMELDENYEGHFSDEGFVFDKFIFGGTCVLGNDVQSAMIDSKTTINFSTKSVAEEIENKLNEFAKYFSKKEDTKIMAKKEIKETIEVEAQVAENFAKEVPKDDAKIVTDSKAKEFDANNQEDDSEVVQAIEDVVEVLDEIEDAIDGGSDENTENEDFACGEKDKENMACNDKEDMKNMSKEDGKKQYTLTFSLSFEDIRSQIYDKLYDMENIENTCYGIVETKDSYFIYADYCSGQFYKQSYVKNDTSIAFTGEREEIFNVFVDQATKDAIASVTYSKLKIDLEEAQIKIQEYSVANTELLKFQSDVKDNERKKEIDGVIARFSKINELDLEKYKQKAYSKEISKEQLEDKLFAELGKMNFSKITGEVVEEKVEVATNYTVSLKEQDKCPYEGCESLFS